MTSLTTRTIRTIAASLALAALCLAALVSLPEPRAMDPINPSGVTGAGLPQPRNGAPISTTRALAAIYDDAAATISRDLGSAIADLGSDPASRGAQFRATRAAALLNQLELAAAKARRQAAPAITRAALASREHGLRDAEAQMRDIGYRPADGFGVDFHRFDQGAAEVVAEDMAARMNSAINAHAARAAVLFRTLSDGPLAGPVEPGVNLAIARGLIVGDPRTADRALRDLLRDPDAPEAETYRQIGARQITVGKWSGPARVYVETVVRTRTREATEEARGRRLDQAGIDLVQITGRVSANFCTRFIGLVVSRGGRTPGYPLLAELPGGGPPFHPNCSKSTAAFVPDLVSDVRLSVSRRARLAYDRDLAAGRLDQPLRAA